MEFPMVKPQGFSRARGGFGSLGNLNAEGKHAQVARVLAGLGGER